MHVGLGLTQLRNRKGKSSKNVTTLCIYIIDLLTSKGHRVRYGLRLLVFTIGFAIIRTRKIQKMTYKIRIVPDEFINKITLAKDSEVTADLPSFYDPGRILALRKTKCTKDFKIFEKFQWVSLNLDSKTAGSPDFTCQVVEFDDDIGGFENSNVVDGFVTSTAMHNLLKRNSVRCDNFDVGDVLCRIVPLLVKTSPSLEKFVFKPEIAASVKLRRITSGYDNIGDSSIVKKWFLTGSRVFSIGDVIIIPTSKKGGGTCDHFIVDVVESGVNKKETRQTEEMLFKTCPESTTIYSGNEVNEYRPSRACLYTSNNEIISIVPPNLKDHVNKLVDIWKTGIKVHLPRDHTGHVGDSPTPGILMYGPVGTGKFTVCKSTANILGVNFVIVNCVNLVGDTSAYTEGKLKALCHKIIKSRPCIVLLKNVHLIGRDKEGHEDKRVIFALQELVSDLEKGNRNPVNISDSSKSSISLPMLLLGTTSEPDKVSPALRNILLQRINMNNSVPIENIAATILWFMKMANVGLSDDFNLNAWVDDNITGKRLLHGDIRAVVAIATRLSCECHFNANTDGPVITDYIKATLSKKHFQKALDNVTEALKASVIGSSVDIPRVSWDDVGGLATVKTELINSIQLPLRFQHLFASRLKRSGILLYGPPGTGKTLIAKAVASEFKLNFLSVKGPELLNMYVGQSEQNVRDVFERARSSAPCILFFDEFDSLAPNRGKSGDSGGVMDRVVSQLLAEMDGTHSSPNVFIIGATNRPDLIDSALLRPGRFDKLLYVGVESDAFSRHKILSAVTRKFSLGKDVNLEEMARRLPDAMTGADISAFCSDAYLTAVAKVIQSIEEGTNIDTPTDNNDENILTVNTADFESALSRVSVSLSPEEQGRYKNIRASLQQPSKS